mgnify:CR=1 FL=1
MEITITIETENAAFDDWEAEITRIMAEITDHLHELDFSDRFAIYDSNGNNVGQCTMK